MRLLPSRARAAVACAVACATAVAAAACTDITTLKQENPGQLAASTLYAPQNAQLIVNGAIADFDCAFTRYVVGSGLLTDELSNAIGSVDNYNYDARRLLTNADYGTATCGNNQRPPIYTTLSVARASADTALARLREWTDAEVPSTVNRTRLIGQMATYAGLSLMLLGEGMCSAAINLGPELQPAQLFEQAKIRFDSAVVSATAANDQPTLNLALLGRARTLLNLKNPAAAATDAARIPAGFVANMAAEGTNNRRQNFAFISINQSNWSTVDASFRGLTTESGVADPRVAVTNTGRAGTAQGSQVWTPDKYATLTTAMPIARYAEAQLIIAEARVAAGDLAGAATAINAARGGRAALGTYSATGQTAAQVLAQIVEERRRELFLEGHRLGDMRRLGIAFTPASGVAYPGGGGVYGTQTCFPMPDVERINNPTISGGTGT